MASWKYLWHLGTQELIGFQTQIVLKVFLGVPGISDLLEIAYNVILLLVSIMWMVPRAKGYLMELFTWIYLIGTS